MSWINVKASINPQQYYEGDNRVLHKFLAWNKEFPLAPFRDILVEGWPAETDDARWERYPDCVLMLHTRNSMWSGHYVKRDKIIDPLFWNQPFTKEWINDLREQIGK